MNFHPIWWLLVLTSAVALGWVVVGARRRVLRTAWWWRHTAVLLLVTVISAQPAIGADDAPDAPPGLDVLFIIDRTTSMGAEDYHGDRPRIEGVAADVERLVTALGPARFAVIVSDNIARVAVPWTTDAAAVVTMAQTVGWREESYGAGSDIAAAVPVASRALAEAAGKRPEARRFLVYFGDGEQTSPDPPTSFAPLAPDLDGALVLGFGTLEGGRMRQRPDVADLVVRDAQVQLSHLDETTLQAAAEELGGSYEHRREPGPLAAALPAAPTMLPAGGDGTFSLGWAAALAALLPLAGGVASAVRDWRRARREVRR